jgi:hypothetical protein
MAMTGMRTFTEDVGLVEESPPKAIAKQRAKGLLRRVPKGRRRAAIEVAHWAYGAQGGFVFGLLPEEIRRAPAAGPAYGLAVWLGFELGIAPLLGLAQAKKPRPVERLVLAVDHLLYGFVLSKMRTRPQE